MRTTTVMAAACLYLTCATISFAAALPKDVRRFVANADDCEHLAGEWDSSLSKADKREIQRGIVRNCRAAQRQLNQLKSKYRDNANVMKILADHEYDSVKSFHKRH